MISLPCCSAIGKLTVIQGGGNAHFPFVNGRCHFKSAFVCALPDGTSNYLVACLELNLAYSTLSWFLMEDEDVLSRHWLFQDLPIRSARRRNTISKVKTILEQNKRARAKLFTVFKLALAEKLTTFKTLLVDVVVVVVVFFFFHFCRPNIVTFLPALLSSPRLTLILLYTLGMACRR